ncbi:MAG: 23S rRNA (pseudouridine(1915)-N(3))-methyltransferase RlmH [Desulfobulbaceae bacterium]|nr:23S rRNA (pseudouridine(1915)-N(3))-methyltransferase RlmH [Desulfobulbaceae bacterium]
MNIDCIFLGHTNEGYLEQGIADFQQRLARYCPVRVKIVKERKGKVADQVRIDTEGRDLLEQLEPKSFVVVLDRTGRQVSSEAFASLFEQWQDQNRRSVSFVIGGALGLSKEVLAAADVVLSLSLMTFTHEMARMILLEQVYRAFTILAGTKYHK